MPTLPFSVLPFTPSNLYASLSSAVCPASHVASHTVAQYLAGYLQALGARTIVIENDYTDGDYLDDFAAYYVKCFRGYDRRCHRLHFFCSDLLEDQVRALICGEIEGSAANAIVGSYLGFIVARPLPGAIVGRTVLRTYESDGGRRHYPVTKASAANLFGTELPVRSLPFQEQDSVLAACATVSLWCAFHKASELFGTAAPSPVAITRVANEVLNFGRPVPSTGLNVSQICKAIREVGLEPEVTEVRSGTPLVSLAYGYLSAGLPVILLSNVEGVGGHAMTLTGYSLRPTPVRTSEVGPTESCIPQVGLRIDEFYAHDDQVGPFCRLNVHGSVNVPGVPPGTFPVHFDGTWLKPTGGFRRLLPQVAVVPVYHKIRITYLDVLKLLTPLASTILAPAAGVNHEWCIFLTTTNECKKTLKASGIAKAKVDSLLLKQHPRFIWRASLSFNGVRQVEFLIDATDMAKSFPIYDAIWHDDPLKAAVHTLLTSAAHGSSISAILTPRVADFLKACSA